MVDLTNKKTVTEFQQRLLSWFNENKRDLPWRRTTNPYHIWISEVMLQQTQVIKVVGYYERFIERFPDIESLAQADLHDVLRLWEGLGYYSRARNLHKAAQVVLENCSGEMPANYDRFLTLPGVGPYIAAAVTSRAFGAPYAVVDGNVKRVLSRIMRIDAPVNTTDSEKQFRETAAQLLDADHPGAFNESMMELGALTCRPQNPVCIECPVSFSCRAYETGTQTAYPRRLSRKKTPTHHIGVGVILEDESFLIIRRPLNGLLGGLWEFPGGRASKDESTEQACVRKIREKLAIEVSIDSKMTTIRHAYTHFKIVMDVYLCRHVSGEVALNGPIDSRWITFNEIGQFAFHIANHKFMPKLGTIITG
ncbi:MAG: A/G-specific adenine glycosylase [candidate division KSB1 bacterium]|jgi:A/G-specific adenine glycosylase|nr:A/G-specific adenine glycosylase [candidate division KSB1 bacterium]